MLFNPTLVSTILLAAAVLASPWDHVQSLKRSKHEYSKDGPSALFLGKNEEPTFASFSFTAVPLTGPNESAVVVSASLSFGCDHDVASAIVGILYASGTTIYKAGLTVPGSASEAKLEICQNDEIKVSVDASSGRVRVKNITTGKSQHMDFKPSELCRGKTGIAVTGAEGSAFGHFGALNVHNIKVSGPSGSYKLSEATPIYMGEADNIEATTTFEGESSITFHQK